MKEFKEYIHLEKYGNDEVQGIELGQCFIFPKIDGTNASLWLCEESGLQAGSRKRHLSVEADNAGFYKHSLDNQDKFIPLFNRYPHWRLYGEFLVPHSLKTYRQDAWRKFYIFDVYDDEKDKYISYEEYEPVLKEFDLEYVPCLCVVKNVSYDSLLKNLELNTFLIEDGNGVGEGIVIKNYLYENKYKRTTWAKLITNSFKEKHIREMGANYKEEKQMIEQQIVDDYIDVHLVDKTFAKIVNENEGWNSKYIPQLLGMVFHDLVNEEIWDIVKKNKMPTINFKTLNTLTIIKVKQIKSELF